ncbi:MAG: aminotransferase class I/II-fold pyridoxal phosphate-dependent enzyme [Alphaproteobacteria bacterium]|nr:aminotransferase class I/II-fold pyridoxal phosphate-dependent enzyme [Alphaproteobacteria bacterium]
MLNPVLVQDYDRYDPMQRYKFEAGKPLFEENYPLNKALCDMSPNIAAELMNYAREKGPDVISLAQGEGCMPTPDFITEAAAKALKEGKTFYGRPLGLPELREEISAYYKRVYGLDIGPGRVFITTSGSNAMNLTLRALLNKGDEVVAITPIWKNLLGAVELSDAHVRQVGLTEGAEGWKLDLDKLFAACNEKTRAILVVSPSNPTGWMISGEEIQKIMEFARARNIWVIADEVYGRLVYDGPRAVSFLDYAEPDDLLMVINSFSKTWAMTGWRLGWITGRRLWTIKSAMRPSITIYVWRPSRNMPG